ncbi:MAG: pentapeptide repeat-containing protein [Deltaproteobacteria bacterium]|nr:pentapeptide repeat-containing protein [Deltaproteobacteria bacterium]
MEFKYISDETFENVSASQRGLDMGEYESCRFVQCDFSSADLRDLRFLESDFVECDLSNADLTNASIQDVRFNKCKMQGLHFDRCNAFGFSAAFDGCQLSYSIFQKMKLQGVSMTRCQLHSVDFSSADLKKAMIQHCDLQDATFDQTNLENADLRYSQNYIINPDGNRLKGARFSLPEVVGLLHKYRIKVDP